MLTIKCASCRKKMWKYKKIGPGEVLRCHRDRITRIFCLDEHDGKIWCCHCGHAIGIDKGSFIKMNQGHFTYSGTKDNSR